MIVASRADGLCRVEEGGRVISKETSRDLEGGREYLVPRVPELEL